MADSPAPEEIWDESSDEGERRLTRSWGGLLATGMLGGIDVMLGVLALVVIQGALISVMPEQPAHLIGSLGFAIGFVLLLVGRSELFTENFMVPFTAMYSKKRQLPSLARLWGGTIIGNLLGIAVLVVILSRPGVLDPEALDAAGKLADTFADRSVGTQLLSAILGGVVVTLLTWLAHAVSSDSARVAIALLVGFLLAAPSLNHAVIGVGEMSFGVLAGTASASWLDVAQDFPIAIAGNFLGGFGFITLARLVQVKGEGEGG